jgi:hypothetical protein
MTTRDDVARQIADELHQVAWPLAPLIGVDLANEILTRVRTMARRLADQLLDDREQDGAGLEVDADAVAAETTIDLMCALWPRGSEPPPEWWRTPLGRAIARSAGTEDAEAVSASVAAAMLGVSRGRVYALLNEGKLDRHPDGGVVRTSVMQRIGRPSS